MTPLRHVLSAATATLMVLATLCALTVLAAACACGALLPSSWRD